MGKAFRGLQAALVLPVEYQRINTLLGFESLGWRKEKQGRCKKFDQNDPAGGDWCDDSNDSPIDTYVGEVVSRYQRGGRG